MVGSIKTVIGHTEGTAGLAGVLKASLAVQHGQIPANLHFNNLNPKVKPFYHEMLRIPTKTTPWPAIPEGAPRRVSINSFGFGGTNAHAILESWGGTQSAGQEMILLHGAGPFVISANSSQSLVASAEALASYLRSRPDTDLDRLAYTLLQRTNFPFRAAFSATTAEQLADKIDARQKPLRSTSRAALLSQSLPPRILGVFTGQGAQWATMSKELYEASDVFRRAVLQMQGSLDSLPESDRPDWRLVDQLRAPAETSRIGEAIISQPLCTALQVALVDVLYAAGIKFSAVVGHSSGEIAAAYAAGYLNSSDAIRVAYYRGLHSHLARGPEGRRGKMMAVGMSLDQARRYCYAEFCDSLVVAASNSQTSCTLAGNAEAVEIAKARLDEKGIFARVLVVDTAYHSHHMRPCAAPYLQSLEKCAIKVRGGGRGRCSWYSSVWGADGRSRSFDDNDDDAPLLGGQYWIDNLTQPVLFDQALTRAFNEDQCFDLVLEVGPHPALAGPISDTIKALTSVSLPYSGLLKRGQSALESFADAMGLLWKTFLSERRLVAFDRVRQPFGCDKRQTKLRILKDLPNYSWDHSNIIWKESRASRAFRTHSQARHELLGHAVTHGEGSRCQVLWKQVLRLNEVSWLRGHEIHGQVLFPASGFLAMSYEAAIRLVEDQELIRLVEIHNVDMVHAMSMEEDSAGLEVLFTVRITSHSNDCITASLACYSGAVDAVQPLDCLQPGLTAHFSADLRLLLADEPGRNISLPSRPTPVLPMTALNMEQVYGSLSKAGLNYSGSFRAKSMLRRLNHTVVTVSSPPPEAFPMRACMHPALVDTALQGIYTAFSFPGDGHLRTTYLPTRLECVSIGSIGVVESSGASVLMADSIVTSADATTLTGDVDVFDAATSQTRVQIRGLRMTAVGQPKERGWLYASKTWERDPAYGIEPGQSAGLSDHDRELYEQLVRTAYFYLRQLRSMIKPPEVILMGKLRKHMMKWITEHLFPQIEAGQHPEIRPEWKNDTLEMIQQWRDNKPSDSIDLNIVHAMGQNLVAIIRGTVAPLKILVQQDMLDRLYVEGLGFRDGNKDLGSMVHLLGHHNGRMRILEVGAGTGGTTRTVLATLGSRYEAYTYTDISTGFFEKARSTFDHHAARMSFKTLNIENDPVDQGFVPGSYDLLIASNCLHATGRLKDTLRRCRQLLRPGGRLVLLEITRDFLPIQAIMATLPGWFLGVDEGRVWAPTVGLKHWDELLKATGFSGVDTSSTPSFCSVIVSQAVDEMVNVIREPLLYSVKQQLVLPPLVQEILIVGGLSGGDGGESTSALAFQIQEIIKPAVSVKIVSLPCLEGVQVPMGAAVLCLADLDKPIFHDMNHNRFVGLQNVLQFASVVLWVTCGARLGKHPLASITPGMGSTLLGERSALSLQFVDVDDAASADPFILAKLFLRLALISDRFEARDELLWTREPELAIRDGVVYVPRVTPLDLINCRSAARFRHVTEVISLHGFDTSVVLNKRRQGGFELQTSLFVHRPEDRVAVRVAASSLHDFFLHESAVPFYVFVGYEVRSGDRVCGLSNVNGSLITVAEDHILRRWHDNGGDGTAAEDSVWLQHFLAQVMARSLLRDMHRPTWIHGAPNYLSKPLDLAVADEGQDLTVFQTTSDMARISEANFIHPYASERDMENLRPSKSAACFINLEHPKNEKLYTSVCSFFNLPASAIISKDVDDLLTGVSLSELRSATTYHNPCYNSALEGEVPVLGIQSIDKISTLRMNKKEMGSTAVIDWSTASTVNASIRPLDHNGLFAADKTYLLVGMTGDLGISVCQWMVDHGAMHVVLASRHPNVSLDVLGFLSRRGATVRTMAMDVTDRASLRVAYADIKSGPAPVVGGVMNAAMVLRDRVFHDMTWEDFAAVLDPKVRGTQNLDEFFSDEKGDEKGDEEDEGDEYFPTTELDFFICFSSATSTVGSIGQSAYAAANSFMASLMQQRRRRGLVGSVVQIAILTGLGYVFRHDAERAAAIYKALEPRLDRQSETDLHEMLAEAIVCGRPGSDQPAELITGVRSAIRVDPLWRNEDPRLSVYISQQTPEDDNIAESRKEQVPGSAERVEDQLLAAGVADDNPAVALAVLEGRFVLALGNMLEMSPDQVDRNLPVASLGIDSLVAIRIREWFLREIGVEVPMLKTMSVNHSLSRLCDDVLVDWRRLRREERADK